MDASHVPWALWIHTHAQWTFLRSVCASIFSRREHSTRSVEGFDFSTQWRELERPGLRMTSLVCVIWSCQTYFIRGCLLFSCLECPHIYTHTLTECTKLYAAAAIACRKENSLSDHTMGVKYFNELSACPWIHRRLRGWAAVEGGGGNARLLRIYEKIQRWTIR